jgi:hypothetical protein
MLMQVKHYERLSPLKSSRQALGSLSDVRAGDCVIAFSRAQIYAIKVGVGAGRPSDQAYLLKSSLLLGAIDHFLDF